jgi:hypothetical protein
MGQLIPDRFFWARTIEDLDKYPDKDPDGAPRED